MAQVVSFCIFDDCEPAYGPFHKSFEGKITKGNVKQTVIELIDDFLEADIDPSRYYCETFEDDYDHEIESITLNLLSKSYYVINRFEKYYVIAFALNYTRFEIFSKDCDKELIKWRDNDEKDHITGIISDPDYNLNPVIKFLQEINGGS